MRVSIMDSIIDVSIFIAARPTPDHGLVIGLLKPSVDPFQQDGDEGG